MVYEVFDEFVAPSYSREGVETFFRHVTVEFLQSLSERFGFVLRAVHEGETVGVIAVRDKNHIALFFVKGNYQGRGVGRALLDRARDIVAAEGETCMHVHSSPFAVRHYEALGFRTTGPEKTETGIRYIPMEADIVLQKRDSR
ncbi:MAG: GNAT family N-acetyltransferase [Chitinispirillaceae bacterium]